MAFRLTVDQFQRLLTVMLAAETPDHLTNVVLIACSRPRDGIISVPVSRSDADAIAAAVDGCVPSDLAIEELAAILHQQRSTASE